MQSVRYRPDQFLISEAMDVGAAAFAAPEPDGEFSIAGFLYVSLPDPAGFLNSGTFGRWSFDGAAPEPFEEWRLLFGSRQVLLPFFEGRGPACFGRAGPRLVMGRVRRRSR
jgi:hypothetical protein